MLAPLGFAKNRLKAVFFAFPDGGAIGRQILVKRSAPQGTPLGRASA
jgi:hypothetical protein